MCMHMKVSEFNEKRFQYKNRNLATLAIWVSTLL